MLISECGDMWVNDLAKDLKARRDKHLRHHALCEPGGIFGEQVMKIAQAYDRAYLAVINESLGYTTPPAPGTKES